MMLFTPLQMLDLTGIGMGGAIMIIGFLALTLWASVQFRNPLAVTMWGLTAMTWIIVGMFEIRDEIAWFGIMMTTIILTVGIVARMVK